MGMICRASAERSTSQSPPAVSSPASRLPVCISPTMSASPPWVPPGKIVNCTLPPETFRHFSPMTCKLLWYELPVGASVPSLMRTFFSAACAMARLTPKISITQHFITCMILFRLLARRRRGAQKQFFSASQQPFGPALHHQVGQAPLRSDIHIDGQRAIEQGLKLFQILALHANRLRQ